MARDQTAPLNTMQYLSKQAHEWTALELFTIFIVPFLAFVTASLLIVFLYEWLPGTTLIILILLFCASLGLFWRGLKDPQRAADYYVGALTGIAMVLGCLVGITAFRWYFFSVLPHR